MHNGYVGKTLCAGGNAVISGYVDARTVAKVSLYTQTTNSSGGYIYVIYVRKKILQKNIIHAIMCVDY